MDQEALAERPPRLLGLALLVAFLAAAPVLFGGRTLQMVDRFGTGVDQAYGYPGPRTEHPAIRDPWGTQPGDTAAAAYFARRIREGVFPLWNPYQGLGQDFLGEPLSAPFYPFTWLYVLVPETHFDLVGVAHLVLAGLGAASGVRWLGLGSWAQRVAAIAPWGIGSLLIFLPTNSILGVAVWLPMLWTASLRLMRGPPDRWVLLATVFGIHAVGTGGHVSLALIGALSTVGVVVLAWLAGYGDRLGLRRLLGAWTLGGLTAAPQWTQSLRYVLQGRELVADYLPVPFRAVGVTEFFFPHTFGPVGLPPSQLFGARFAGFDVPGAGGVGFWAAPLGVLALLGLLEAWRRKGPWLGIAGVTIGFAAWAFGIPPFSLLWKAPLLHRLKPEYLMFVPNVAGILLAALGIERALRERDRRDLLVVVAILGTGALAVVGPALTLGALGVAGRAHLLKTSGLVAGAASAAAMLGWLWSRPGDGGRPWVLLALVTLALVAVFPNGSLAAGARQRNLAAAASVVLVGLGLTRAGRRHAWWLAGCGACFGFFVHRQASRPAGLPTRHAPFLEGPYFSRAATGPDSPWRAYGLQRIAMPNLSGLSQHSTVNHLGALAIPRAARFQVESLDGIQNPVQLWGQTETGGHVLPRSRAWVRMVVNREAWRRIGTRFVFGRQLPLDHDASPGLVWSSEGPTPAPPFRPLPDTSQERAERVAALRAGSAQLPAPSGALDGIRIPVACDPTPPDQVGLLVFRLGPLPREGGLVVRGRRRDGKETEALRVPGAGLGKALARQVWVYDVLPVPEGICDGVGKEPVLLEVHPSPRELPVAFQVDRWGGVSHLELRRAENGYRLVARVGDGEIEVWEDQRALPRLQFWETLESAGRRAWPATGEIVTRRFRVGANSVEATVEVPGPGYLVLMDVMAPGWTARVDGIPVQVGLAAGVFRGVQVGAGGTHEVVFEYWPPGLSAALVAAALGLLGLVIWGVALPTSGVEEMESCR